MYLGLGPSNPLQLLQSRTNSPSVDLTGHSSQVFTVPKKGTGVPRAHTPEGHVECQLEAGICKCACMLLQVALDPAECSIVQGCAVEAVRRRV